MRVRPFALRYRNANWNAEGFVVRYLTTNGFNVGRMRII